ncbi:MAG: Uma2 family endonuclease [Chloroflexi bacterium]|nr:Uma2 family endonuclease [Chloroflexota bacterium]
MEEFLQLPEEKPYLELVDGVVKQKAAPQWLHGLLQLGFGAGINQHAWPRQLAVAFSEIREAFGRDSLVPDIGVYRWERVPRTEAGEVVNGPPTPPNIAIEIRSPDQGIGDLVDKCRRFLAHGTELALVVVPEHRTVILVRADESVTTLRGDDRIDLSPVLPDFELTVRELFEMLVMGRGRV